MARRNTGSVRQRRPGVFQVSVDLSKVRKLTPQEWASPLTQRRRYETVEGTREDAERRLHELLYEADSGTLPKGKMTLNTWLGYWLREYVDTELRPSTIEDYHMQVRNYIGPLLGSMYLHEIKAHHIQEFQNRLAGKVGSSVVRKLRQVLSGALREAVNNDVIPTKPREEDPHPEAGAAEGGGAVRRAGATTPSRRCRRQVLPRAVAHRPHRAAGRGSPRVGVEAH